MTDPGPTIESDRAEPEHRASWLELFFDLVVVVAIATLTERLEEHSDGSALALVLIMYLAIWLVWTSFMLYANVAAEKTHRRAMLWAMGLIAIMAAAVPEADNFQRGRVFAIAYIAARLVASGSWRNTTQVLVEWPIAQLSVGLLPWFVSIWVHDPYRYYLWALGLALDVGYALWSNGSGSVLDRFKEEAAKRAAARRRRTDRRGPVRGRPDDMVELTAVEVNQSHFGERLGTFTIIVLGEAVSQIVMAASRVEWDKQFMVAAISAFMLLFGLWWLTFRYSSYTEGATKVDALPPHLALPVHFLTTASIILMAAGLGDIVGEPDEPMGTGLRWLLGGGMAAYVLVTQTALALTSPGGRSWWLVAFGVAVIAAPLLLAGFGGQLEDWVLGVGFALIIGAQVTFRKVDLIVSGQLPDPREN